MAAAVFPWRLQQAPRPDFLHPQGRIPWTAKAWCAMGLMTLVVAGLDVGSAWRDRVAALEAVDQAHASVQAGRRHDPARTPAARRDMAGALPRPGERHWRTLLGAVEDATGPGVRWMTLQHGVDGVVRLQGTADSPQTVWAVVQSLREQPGWQQVMPVLVGEVDERGRRSFEIVANATGVR